MPYFQVNENCNGCLACVHNCPANALSATDEGSVRTLSHNMARCARCGNCWRVCPQDAIEFQHLLENRWEPFKTLELIRCRVCGEPVYTDDFRKTLSEKSVAPGEPLCPLHREVAKTVAEAHFIARRED